MKRKLNWVIVFFVFISFCSCVSTGPTRQTTTPQKTNLLVSGLKGDITPFFSKKTKNNLPSIAFALKFVPGKGWQKQISSYCGGYTSKTPITQEMVDYWARLNEMKKTLTPAKTAYKSNAYARWNNEKGKWVRVE